jgi:hypothetical protein
VKINGWKRIGIIASVAWILGAGIYVRVRESTADQHRERDTYVACVEDQAKMGNEASQMCADSLYADTQRDVANEQRGDVLTVFVPVPLAWGAVYLLLFLARWVRRGFAS